LLFLIVLVTAVGLATPRPAKGSRSDSDLLEENPASTSNVMDRPQPVIFTFGYGGLVNTYVTALYVHDTIFLPIHSLLNDLKVDNQLDMQLKTVTGFYGNESNKYELNFRNLTAKVGDKTFNIDSSAFLAGPVDYYISPDLFKELFKLDFTIDMNRLEIILSTTVKLPIIEDYERQVNLQYQSQSSSILREQAPLAYDRQRALLNGGILDYSLASFYGDGRPSYSYSTNEGAEMLGGDIEGTLSGDLVNGRATVYSDQVHWRYVVDSTWFLTSMSAGNLVSTGLNQYSFRGIEVSNQPIQIRRLFGNYAYIEKVQPGWDTELYLNGERVGFTKADALGNVHFDLPLVYGTSFIQLKTYGPTGQYREVDRRLQIPFTLIPAGDFDYSMDAGELETSGANMVQANGAYGLTDWLTDKAGADYLQSSQEKNPLLYNSLTLRIGAPYIATFETAPSYVYETSLNAIYSSQASLGLTFDRYVANTLYNPAGRREQLSLTGYLPFYLGDNTMNFNFSGDGQTYHDGTSSLTYTLGTSVSLSRLNFAAAYTPSYQYYSSVSAVAGKTLTASLMYSFFVGSGPFKFLNGAVIGVTSDFDLIARSMTDSRLDASQYIGKYASVQFSAERNFTNRSTSFNVQIMCNLPFIQTSTSIISQDSKESFSQYASGSISYDSDYQKFLFNGVHWSGQSAASIRMFLDENQDGKYDKGDEIIKEGDITLRQAVSLDSFPSGIIRAWDLLPYTQYSADIQSGSLQNPLWMPKQESFSFITDPNTYKTIDIPFYSAGVIQGSVRRKEGERERAVPGIEVIVESLHGILRKTISAFNDGSIYYVGIPPGDYKIEVDPSQLNALGDESVPAYREFTVKFKKAGDFIKGLNFILKPIPKPEVEPVSKP